MDFFGRALPVLCSVYRWKIPAIEGFVGSGKVGLQPNLELKEYLHALWTAADKSEQLGLAGIIVRDWGGVRSNSDATLANYVDVIQEPEPVTPIRGVASYSKIFSIAFPERYAIYDARVAACLNAVQLNAGLEKGIAFNYVPGRNNVVGNLVTKRGFTQLDHFSVRSLCRIGWKRIKRDETYQRYLELLFDCLPRVQGATLPLLEMALFANAERECQIAMNLANPEI